MGLGVIDVAARARRAAHLASLWCLSFAALHVYWALGGSIGLAASAGADLAQLRPGWFVVGGLWGVAALLLLSAAFCAGLGHGWPRGSLRRVAVVVAWLAGAALLARGILVELVLATGIGGVSSSVGPLETRWSLVLWNPWLSLGGLAFLPTGHHLNRLRRATCMSSQAVT